jgi:hypothetical protein
LHEGESQLREAIAEGAFGAAEATLESLDEGTKGVDRKSGGSQVRRLVTEVDRRQLEKAVAVVGDDLLYRSGG